MFCPQCGTQNTEIAAFCQRCGYPLQEQTAMKKHEKMKKPKRKRHWIVATLCALVILVVFGRVSHQSLMYIIRVLLFKWHMAVQKRWRQIVFLLR